MATQDSISIAGEIVDAERLSHSAQEIDDILDAENARVEAEAARNNAESIRVNAEAARATAETARASSETARKTAEAARVKAETARATAETARETAEQNREDKTNGIVAQAATQVTLAEAAADRAEQAKETILLDEEKIEQAKTDAETSALLSRSWAVGATGTREGEDVDNSKYWAGVSQGYAESASTPAVEGVYNVILADRVTGEKYALLAEGGRLTLLGVADTLEATDWTLIDPNTGIAYAVVVDEGRLGTEEVQ